MTMDLRAMDVVKEEGTGNPFAVISIVQYNPDGSAYALVGRLDGQGGPFVLFRITDKGDAGFVGHFVS